MLPGADGDVPVAGMIYACQHEKVFDLADVMRRRVSVGWGERLGCDVAHDVAAAIREPMGWSAPEAAAKAEAYVVATRQQFGLSA